MKSRYLIAIDSKGVYLRRTLCVEHRWDTGEVVYTAKPVKAYRVPKRIREVYEEVSRKLQK